MCRGLTFTLSPQTVFLWQSLCDHAEPCQQHFNTSLRRAFLFDEPFLSCVTVTGTKV